LEPTFTGDMAGMAGTGTQLSEQTVLTTPTFTGDMAGALTTKLVTEE